MNSLRTIAKLATLVVIGGGTIGAAVGITQAQSFHDVPQSAEAIANAKVHKDRIYLKPFHDYKKDNVWFAAKFFNEQDPDLVTWKKMELANLSTDIWSCDYDLNFKNVSFYRMKPDDRDILDVNNSFNHTKNLTCVGGNVFTMNDNDWNNGDGVWSEYAETNYETVNIWVVPNGWEGDNAEIKIGVFGGNQKPGFEEYKVSEVYGNKYYRFVVQSDAKAVKFTRRDPNDVSKKYNESNDMEFKPNSVYYLNYDKNLNFHTFGACNPKSVSAEMFNDVLEPIKVCSNSDINGYNAYPDLKEKFYDCLKPEVIENGLLNSVSNKDYSKTDYDNNNKSYNNLDKNISITANNKWTGIERMYTDNKGNPTLDTDMLNNTALVAGSVTVLATSLIAGFAYLLNKRKISA